MTTFPDHNAVLYMARCAVQEYVNEQAEEGKLEEVAANEQAAVTHLVNTSLLKVIASGEVRLAMVRRWMSEAIANERIDPHQQPVLTGLIVYDLWNKIRGLETTFGLAVPWCELSIGYQTSYTRLAEGLMVHLHLCSSCGRHPANGVLTEFAGAQYCDECRYGQTPA